MIYILYGADDYSCREELRNIKKDMGDQEMLAVNTTVFDGKKLSPEQLINGCQVIPFLHPVRLIIVEQFLERFESERRQKANITRNKNIKNSGIEEWYSTIEILVKIPSTTVLLFIDGTITNGNKMLIKLAPLATVKTFPALQGEHLSKWILNKVKENNGEIANDAVRTLMDLIGNDLWLMSTEIDKLIAYKSGSLINANDVRQLSEYNRDVNIFTLVDAIIEGHVKEAHGLIHRLFMEGNNASMVFTMIARQLRLIIIATEFTRDMSSSQMLDRLSVTSKFVLEKTMKQARLYSLEQLRNAYHLVLGADLSVKTGQFNDDNAVDLLVIELCQKKAIK
jgi:DNA polymerase III subunit delta